MWKLVENLKNACLSARSVARRTDLRLKARALITLALFLLTANGALAATPSMSARLDRDSAAVGESVTLTLTFEGVSPKGPPNLPPLAGVQASYSGQSSAFNFINGESSSSVSFTYNLVPTQPGEITIPAMQAQVDGRNLTSQPLKLKILKADAAATAAQNTAAFVKLIVPKT